MSDWKTFLIEGKVRTKTQKWKNMVHMKKRENSVLLAHRARKRNHKRNLESCVHVRFLKSLNDKLGHLS